MALPKQAAQPMLSKSTRTDRGDDDHKRSATLIFGQDVGVRCMGRIAEWQAQRQNRKAHFDTQTVHGLIRWNARNADSRNSSPSSATLVLKAALEASCL